jgi:hypothetical protein
MKRLCDILLESSPQTGHEVVHHISPHDISEFHPLSHFGTYKAARAVGSYTHGSELRKEFGKGYDSGPMYRNRFHYKARLINKGNTFHLNRDEGDHSFHGILSDLSKAGHMTPEEVEHHTAESEKFKTHKEASTYIANAIRSKGIHTLSYTNEFENPGKKSYIITHPNQVHILKKSKIIVKSNQHRLSKGPNYPPVKKL